MTLIRTVAPVAEPVTLSEAKAFLRLSGTSEDDLLAGLIRAAREDVERSTGLALIAQTWRLVLDALPPGETVCLMRGPVRAILSVTAYGRMGEASLVAPTSYRADTVSRPARLLFLARPTIEQVSNGLEIDFTAGYGEAGTDVPDLLKRAILLLVAHWYEFRAAFGPGDQPVSYPPAYARLIATYRPVRL